MENCKAIEGSIACGQAVGPTPISHGFPICDMHWSKFEQITAQQHQEVAARILSHHLEERNKFRKAASDAIQELTRISGMDFDQVEEITRPTRQERQPQLVYFIECQNYIKIGASSDPEKQLRGLQVSGNGTRAPRGIDLHDAQLMATTSGGLEKEKALHRKFSHLRVDGEWFKAVPELLEFIDDAKVVT